MPPLQIADERTDLPSREVPPRPPAIGDTRQANTWLVRPQAYFVLVAVTLIVRTLSFHISVINPDEDAFLLAAREILHGHLPYLTFFDDKPVGTSALLALVLRLFGTSVLTVRLFGASCVFLAAVGIYEIGRHLIVDPLRSNSVPLGAGILFIAYSTAFGGLATMTEIMLAPFTCAGVAFFCAYLIPAPAGKKPMTIFLAGLAFGLAIWIKTVPIVPAVCLGMFALVYPFEPRNVYLARIIRHGLLYSAGILLPTAITVLVYFQAGHLGEFIYANFGFMGSYLTRPSLAWIAMNLIGHALAIWPLVLLTGIAVVLDGWGLLRRKPIPFRSVFLYIWLFSELFAATASLRLWGHNFLTLLPPLALLSALALWWAIEMGGLRGVSYGALVGLAALIILVPTEWATAQTHFTHHDAQHEAALAIERAVPKDDRKLLVLSYDFLLDYVLTNSSLPQKVVIPGLLYSDMSRMVDRRPFEELTQALDANPQLILVDLASLRIDAGDAAFHMIEAKLQADYHPIDRITDLHYLDTATYAGHDVVIYEYNAPLS